MELKLETPGIFLPTPVCLPDEDFLIFSLHLCEMGENNWILTSGNVLLIRTCALDISLSSSDRECNPARLRITSASLIRVPKPRLRSTDTQIS